MASFFKRSVSKIKFSNPFKKSEANSASESAKQSPKKEAAATRLKKYLNVIYTDYKDVALHTAKSAKENPFKTLGYGLSAAAVLVFYKKTPTYIDYVQQRKELMNDMLMCGSTYSKRGSFYLNELNRLENLNQLEYKSCVLFSLVMVKKFSEHESTYEKRCTQLNSPNKYNIFNVPNVLLKFVSRIVDIGFFDRWYFLNKNMQNYDVDEIEWLNNEQESNSKNDNHNKAVM